MLINNKLKKENKKLRDKIDELRRLLYRLDKTLDYKQDKIIELSKVNRNLKDKLELAENTIEKQKYIIELLEQEPLRMKV